MRYVRYSLLIGEAAEIIILEYLFMNENETQQSTTQTETTAVETVKPKKKNHPQFVRIIGAVLVVVLIILAVLYRLEKEGRSPTNIFSKLIERQEAARVVVIVNGEEIRNAELQTSIKQFSKIAESQGMEATNEDIKDQALEVLINTSLLKQEATSRGMSVTDEEVTERVNGIQEELGGAEVLQQRMNDIGVDLVQLQADVKDELLIKRLLDQIFADANIQITDEDVTAAYEAAGGTEAGLPAIDEIRPQIESQIKSQKEQSVIDELLTSLKEKATIDKKEGI